MNKKVIYCLNLIMVVCCLSVYGQQPTALETLTKVEAYYKALKTYDFEMEYKMYRGYTGNTITEAYKGTMYKKDNISQVHILGTEILQFPETQLVINKENKTVIYTKTKQDAVQKPPVEVSTFLKFYNETSTKISGHTIIHEMDLKPIQFPVPIQYNKIIIHVNKNTYQVEKQVLYFATKLPFVDENGKETLDVGRMEVNLKQKPTSSKKDIKLSNYVYLDANNKVHLTKHYATYSIINQTNL